MNIVRLEGRISHSSVKDVLDSRGLWRCLFVLALVVIATLRVLWIALPGEPSGLDFGNWLMIGNDLLGKHLERAAHIDYPPLVPLVVVVATSLLGVVWGTALVAGVASVLPAVGVYVCARMFRAERVGILVAVVVAASSSSGEAAAWGGVPQLVGLALVPIVLGMAQLVLRDRSPRHALMLGMTLLLLGATTHLVLAQVALALVVLVIVNLGVRTWRFRLSTWKGRTGWLALIALTALPCVALIPLYLKLGATVGQSVASRGASHVDTGSASFVDGLVVVYRDLGVVWKPVIALTFLSPLMLIVRNRRSLPSLWLISTALVISLWFEAFLPGRERYIYLVPLAAALVVASAATWSLSVFATRRPGLLQTGFVLAGCAALAVAGLRLFPGQRDYYGTLQPPGTIEGLAWIRSHTPRDSLMAVAPVNGAPFGWWVQGYGQRSALVGSEDRWLNFPSERHRAEEVVTMLSAPNPLSDQVLHTAEELGVGYLVLPWSWGGLLHADLDSFRNQHPDQVVFDNRAMVIVEVRAPDSFDASGR